MGSRPQGSTFPASSRLKKRRDFKRVQGRGKKIWGRRFIYMISQGKSPGTRLGITVSRKVGNAVKRNRIKRWIREVFRSHPDLFNERVDIVVIAKRNIDDFSFENIRDEFIDVVGRYVEGRDQRSRSASSTDHSVGHDREGTS